MIDSFVDAKFGPVPGVANSLRREIPTMMLALFGVAVALVGIGSALLLRTPSVG